MPTTEADFVAVASNAPVAPQAAVEASKGTPGPYGNRYADFLSNVSAASIFLAERQSRSAHFPRPILISPALFPLPPARLPTQTSNWKIIESTLREGSHEFRRLSGRC